MAQAILDIEIKGIKEAQVSMDALSASIVKVEQNQKQLNQQRKDLEKRLATNQKALQELNKAYAEGEMTEKEYAAATQAVEKSNESATKALVRNKTAIANNKAELADLNKEHKQAARLVNAEADTLDELRRKLALAQTEYGKLDQSTEKGRIAAEKFAAEINKLSADVKEQEAAIGDNRRNVGNYGDALKGVTPFLGSFGAKIDMMTSGLSGMTEALSGATENLSKIGGTAQQAGASVGGLKGAFQAAAGGIAQATRAAIAFISTGIGAAIAALAGIGLATKAFIDYNAEVQKTNALISGLTNESGKLVDQIRIQSDAISQTLGVEQEQLVQSAKVLVQQFGISYEEALGKIQNGLLATNGANDEFLQSIGEYSTFFSQAGFSVEEFANLINAGFDLGIYTDKLPDALKEADISLREQTKATRDALENAFGPEFTQTVLDQVNTGAITTKQALEMIAEQSDKVVQKNGEIGLSSEQAATLTADVFRGAGEDAGGALKVFEAINVSLEEQTSQLDEQGIRLQQEIERQQEVAEARDRALNSDAVQSFMKVLKDLAAFFTKVFFGTIELFATIVDVSIIQPIEFVVAAFTKLKAASADAAETLRSITSALGFTSRQTDKATQSTSKFIDKLLQQKQTQAEANEETEKAAIVLDEARERAEGYVEALQDIITEQQRQPLILQAEDIFSDRTAEEITTNLENVAQQIERNANITSVNVAGITLTVEEYTKLAQDALNNLEQSESASSNRRSSRRDKERKEAQKRLDDLKAIVDAEVERNLTEEELLTKRLNDKLTELELDKEVTALTEQELAARTALFAKYNDDVQLLREAADEEERLANEKRNAENIEAVKAGFAERLALIQQDLTLQSLTLETAHLEELRNFQGTEQQKLELLKEFQMKQLQLQKDAIVAQIQAIENAMTFATADDLLQGLQAGVIDESSGALAELRNALAAINLEIQEAGKDEDGEPKTLADRLGLNEKQVERINKGVAGVEAGLDAMSQMTQANAAERLANVDQMLEQGVINEEEAERKKEKIKKDAARKQQKIDIVQALINTAKAVTAGLASQPFLPVGLIMGGIAAAQGAAQVKMIKAQKFAKGGLLSGPSHAQGGIPMFSKGGAFYGEAEGGEAVLTKGVMKNPALASMASAINVAGGGVPFFENGGVLQPIQSATPTDRAADIIATGLKSRQPVLVVEQLRERENSVDVIESLRTIG